MNNNEAKKTILEVKDALNTALEAMDKLEKVKAAMEEIAKERDKSYACEALGHGWGLQSALEILERVME